LVHPLDAMTSCKEMGASLAHIANFSVQAAKNFAERLVGDNNLSEWKTLPSLSFKVAQFLITW